MKTFVRTHHRLGFVGLSILAAVLGLLAVLGQRGLEPRPALAQVYYYPDLTVTEMGIELETGGDCNFTPTLGVRVVVKNIGLYSAGPFVVDVNGSQQTVASGLAANATVSLWFSGYVYGKNTAFADATLLVTESNETNNTLSQIPPIPTLPLPCTPTSTPTPTPTPPPVGGVSIDPTQMPPGGSAGYHAGLLASAAGALALGGAMWWARRRGNHIP